MIQCGKFFLLFPRPLPHQPQPATHVERQILPLPDAQAARLDGAGATLSRTQPETEEVLPSRKIAELVASFAVRPRHSPYRSPSVRTRGTPKKRRRRIFPSWWSPLGSCPVEAMFSSALLSAPQKLGASLPPRVTAAASHGRRRIRKAKPILELCSPRRKTWHRGESFLYYRVCCFV